MELPETLQTLRSPICCILGHVDHGKTSLLDYLRHSNVQSGEAGGITQQIGATFFPKEMLNNAKIPGLLIMDTPGHEAFRNLRSRGSALCDIAILVVDITQGFEPQTLESIELLKKSKTPFIVALNKIDRVYCWSQNKESSFRGALNAQHNGTKVHFRDRILEMVLRFAEVGLNAVLFDENPDTRKWISMIPISALTGVGIPDLITTLVELTQERMAKNLTISQNLKCRVLEVKKMQGLGTALDVILVDGVLHVGDTIVVCGLDGLPIKTKIRALLTPEPMHELRIKSPYIRHKYVTGAMGLKIVAPNLHNAVAGSIVVLNSDESADLVTADMKSLTCRNFSLDGILIKASTLGSLEALYEHADSNKIPVAHIGLGTVYKKDILKIGAGAESDSDYACLLAFDVDVTTDAMLCAQELGVTVFTGNVIYHLFDQMEEHLNMRIIKRKEQAQSKVIFPCKLQLLQIFNAKAPIVIGVEVTAGVLKIGTPLTTLEIEIGTVHSIQTNGVDLSEAHVGDRVAIKIVGVDRIDANRHLNGDIISKITRESIDVLKMYFRDEMKVLWWKLIQKDLKPMLGIK